MIDAKVIDKIIETLDEMLKTLKSQSEMFKLVDIRFISIEKKLKELENFVNMVARDK